MVVKAPFYTVDMLWEISRQNADKHFELIEGELYEMSPAGWLHGDIALKLGIFIGNYVLKHKLGRVTAAETGFILHQNLEGKDTVAAPDVGFIDAARIPETLPEKYVPFAPDLAVEVVSPGDKTEKITAKVELYLRYGVRLVWVVYPSQKKIHVYRPAESANKASVEFLNIDDTLNGENVLPGFQLAVRDLFED